METLSDIMNTQNSYSVPSPNFSRQKKLFNSKVDYSFLRNGHKGENDFEEESLNISNNLDKTQNRFLNINVNNPIKNEIKPKGILDMTKIKQQLNPSSRPQVTIQEKPVIIQQIPTQQPNTKLMARQRSIIKMWKLDPNKKENQVQLQDKSPERTKNNTKESEYYLGLNLEKKSAIFDSSNQGMTQEEMKIRNIFLKKFEVKRDQKIKKFMRILISRWVNRRLNLKEGQLNLINDKAYFYQTSIENQNNCLIKYFTKIFSTLANTCQIIPVLNPTNTWKLFWDFFMITVLGFFLYAYSALIFFAQSEKYVQSLYAKFAFICFSFDILLNFNTSFYSKDSIIISRINIAKQQVQIQLINQPTTQKNILQKRYLRSTFSFDFISAFILGLSMNKDNFVQNEDNSVVIYIQNSLVLLKIVSFQYKIKHLEQSVPMKEIWRHILSLVGLLASIVIVAHCVAIIWNAIGQYENSVGIENNWQAKLGIQNQSWDVRYIYSLYWSITTMCTVGYGDISPLNPLEVAFVTLDIIFVSTVFAYSINSIGIILSDIAKISKQYKEDLSIMNRFLSRKQVNIDLQFRVKKYLEFLAQEEKEVNKKAEDAVIDKLSSHLKEQINIEVNTKILRKYPLFAKNFSERTLQKLVFMMKEVKLYKQSILVVVTPNELIIQEGQKDDCSLYLITKGEVEIYSLCDPLYQNSTANKRVLSHLGKDQYFGELSFFTGYNRIANVRSLSLTSMYKITQQQFIETLKSSNDQDFEKYCMIRDQIFNGNFDSIQLQCFSCNEQGHVAIECPQITYDADRIIRVFRMNYSEQQEEKQYQRFLRGKKKSLKLIQSEAIRKAQSSLSDVIDEYLRRMSKIQLESRLSFRGLEFRSIAEMDNDDCDSKDDSQELSENRNVTSEDIQQSKDQNNNFNNNNYSLQIVEEEKKLDKIEEENSKKERLLPSDINNDKISAIYSSFTQSSSRQGSDYKIKPNMKEAFRMRSRAQNTTTLSKQFDTNSNLKTLRKQYFFNLQMVKDNPLIQIENIQGDQELNNEVEKSNLDVNKLPSEVGIQNKPQKTEELDLNKFYNKQSTITTASLMKRDSKRDSLMGHRESLHSQFLNVVGLDNKGQNKQEFIQKQQNSINPSIVLDTQFAYRQRESGEDFKDNIDDFFKEFDKMKSYKQYFPKFNINIVLQDFQHLKKKIAKILKYRCKQMINNSGNKKVEQSNLRKSNKKILLQQIIKNKITERIHPIVYGAAGIQKYPYSR